jgi:hypothetical protein
MRAKPTSVVDWRSVAIYEYAPQPAVALTAEEVLRELKALGFSDIGKVVRWRPEVVYEENSRCRRSSTGVSISPSRL